jgi:nucleoporin NUP82
MTQDDWSTMLEGHPIFTLPKGYGGPTGQSEESLELSTNTLKKSILERPLEDPGLPLSGRRQIMVLKDSDLILAAGCELRITSLSDSKLGRSTNKLYKVRANSDNPRHGSPPEKILNAPDIQFWIRQLALNPSGKLIAVAGAYQVAVVVLPRAGYSKLVPSSVDCK